MVITRAKRSRNFSIIGNDIIEDQRLSFKARGLLIYMLSKPDDWKFYSSELVKHSDKDGREAINNAIKEIEAVGYLRRKQVRSEHGKFGSTDWELLDTPAIPPQTGFPYTDKPSTGKPFTENPQLLNTDNTNTNNTNTESMNECMNDGWNETAVVDFSSDGAWQEVIQLWSTTFGYPNPILITDLQEDAKETSTEVLLFVVKSMLSTGANYSKPANYLHAVMKNYADHGVKTVEQAQQQVQAHEAEVNLRRKKRGNYNKPRIKEQLPDWAKNEQQPKPIEEPVEFDTSERDALLAQLRAKQDSYLNGGED